MATSKVVSYFDTQLIGEVEKAAESDEQIAGILSTAKKAGAVLGAAVHAGDATKEFAALADSVAAPIMVLKDSPTDAGALLQFRLLCGAVNAGIQAAQVASKRAAIAKCEASKMADYAKRARDRIVKGLDRAMALYEVKVNWQAVSWAPTEAPTEDSDADKAGKAIARAFKLDGEAAAIALLKLEAGTILHLADLLQRAAIGVRNKMEGDKARAEAAAAEEAAQAAAEAAA